MSVVAWRVGRAPRWLAPAAATVLVAWGCAPSVTRPPTLSAELRRLRFERALAARQARLEGVEAPASVWARLPGVGRLPGLDARLWIGGPDSLRVVVNGFFGPALEACALADSVTVWVPSRRAALRADAARDSLGLARPGEWGAAALGALWEPPAEAWREGAFEESLLVVSWRASDGHERRLAVGASGLPRRFTMELAPDRRAVASYRNWRLTGGVAWPMLLELADEERSWQVTLKLERVRFVDRAGRGPLGIPIPEDAETWTWRRLRRALGVVTTVGG